MAGERQTEPHQADLEHYDSDRLIAWRTDCKKAREERDKAEAELARVRAERDERCAELSAQSMRWERLARENGPRLSEEQAISRDLNADLTRIADERDEAVARAEAAEDECVRLRAEFDGMTDLHDQKHRDWQAAEARAENHVEEIVALIRSYADVHMTKALADLIEHKYGGGAGT